MIESSNENKEEVKEESWNLRDLRDKILFKHTGVDPDLICELGRNVDLFDRIKDKVSTSVLALAELNQLHEIELSEFSFFLEAYNYLYQMLTIVFFSIFGLSFILYYFNINILYYINFFFQNGFLANFFVLSLIFMATYNIIDMYTILKKLKE